MTINLNILWSSVQCYQAISSCCKEWTGVQVSRYDTCWALSYPRSYDLHSQLVSSRFTTHTHKLHTSCVHDVRYICWPWAFFSHRVCLPVLLQLNLKVLKFMKFMAYISFLPFMCSLYCPSAFAFFLSRLHEVLMDLQQQQLQQLSDWLTQTEERIRRIETQPAAKDMEAYKEQIEQHKVRTVYR